MNHEWVTVCPMLKKIILFLWFNGVYAHQTWMTDNQKKLVSAVCRNDLESVETMVRSGVSPNFSYARSWGSSQYYNGYQWTLLHEAVNRGYENIVLLLVSFGADANRCDTRNYTPIHWAVMIHRPRMLGVMLSSLRPDNHCDLILEIFKSDQALYKHAAQLVDNVPKITYRVLCNLDE